MNKMLTLMVYGSDCQNCLMVTIIELYANELSVLEAVLCQHILLGLHYSEESGKLL